MQRSECGTYTYSFVKFSKEANASHVNFPLPHLFTFGTRYKNIVYENMIVYRLRSICFSQSNRKFLLFGVDCTGKRKCNTVGLSPVLKSKNFYVVTLLVCDKVLSDFT